MNLAQLRALRALDEAGSVTGAADLLGVTQSAVSHALTSLETELGTRLAVRDRAGCRLTDAGRRALPHATAALRHVARLAEETAAASGVVRGRLRVGTLPSAARVLAPLVRAYRDLHPDVETILLEGTDDEVSAWLAAAVVDLGVVTAPAGTIAVPLAADAFVAVMHSAHPLATEAKISLDDLADDPFLISDGGCETLVRRLHRERGVPYKPVHRVREMATLLALVREDIGVSLVPSLALPERPDGIAQVPLAPTAPRILHLAAHDRPGPAARAFLRTVRRGAGG
ncbi:Hydrogen peroxide-inducible genes activator [Actinomadura rubteroloni]|uniref:Hydrogen peroxide-inducible genes activator n=1 Tax=Actinomadura rubteroloni TaxID=1926885 RepID=A0A2P4UIS2_9ACTN|nr:LysR family transcriptional regulator [Actinomadura rubteroloni]POM24921.1 Hydrogen peroxide-inducible genes activator [Actinomadura rubteroloni]